VYGIACTVVGQGFVWFHGTAISSLCTKYIVDFIANTCWYCRRSNLDEFNVERQADIDSREAHRARFKSVLDSLKHGRAHNYTIGERRIALLCMLRTYVALLESGDEEAKALKGKKVTQIFHACYKSKLISSLL